MIKKKIKNLIKKYKNFLIGFSGGLDSTVLINSLNKEKKKKKINIRAIHINHNLNKNSKKWEKHCIKICKILNIKIIIKNIYIKKKSNIESISRKKRYKLYIKYLKKKEILLTAHHKNDQCETILLSIKRGSGLKGLSGIKKKIIYKNKIILRPFIEIEKKKIEKYAIKKKLIWINDNNNKNIKFDRNFLRILIIPIIIKRWPFFLSTISRSAKICYKQNKLINKLLKKKFKKSLKINNSLNIKYLFTLEKEENFFIIRKWIYKKKKKILSYKLINLLWNKIISSKKKYITIINFKNFSISKYKNNLYLIKNYKNNTLKTIVWKNFKKKIFLPNNSKFLYIKEKFNKKNKKNLIRKPKKNESVYIKFNIKDRIKILGQKYKKKIKNIWQEHKILPWNRSKIPIIYYNNKPIISPNLFITEYGKINNSKSWKINLKKKTK